MTKFVRPILLFNLYDGSDHDWKKCENISSWEKEQF